MRIVCFLVALLVTQIAISGPSLSQGREDAIGLRYFGYAAIACDHDDPLDAVVKTDYSDEVAAFTNANQVCVTGNMVELSNRLRETAALFTPVFYVEPVFFSQGAVDLEENPDRQVLWDLVRGAIAESGVSPSDLIFYIVDEPTLRGLDLDAVSRAALVIRGDYPGARILMIEAYHGPFAPIIPAEVDIWGFDAYAIPDPLAEPLYTDYLDLAGMALGAHQSLAIIMDANHTPFHEKAGISETEMAGLARKYLALAESRNDVSMILAYTWAGGIDNLEEKGIRDLPESVIKAHREIGLQILQNR